MMNKRYQHCFFYPCLTFLLVLFIFFIIFIINCTYLEFFLVPGKLLPYAVEVPVLEMASFLVFARSISPWQYDGWKIFLLMLSSHFHLQLLYQTHDGSISK